MTTIMITRVATISSTAMTVPRSEVGPRQTSGGFYVLFPAVVTGESYEAGAVTLRAIPGSGKTEGWRRQTRPDKMVNGRASAAYHTTC